MNIEILKRKLKDLVRKNIEKEKTKIILEKLRVFINFKKEYGDYSTNLVFLLKNFAPEKENKILSLIEKELNGYFSEIKIINNHLNFFLNDYQLIKNLKGAFKNIKKLFFQNYGKNKKVNIDYVSANPTGPLTIGNSRGAALGDLLFNILKLLGFKVIREYYVNDRGTQIELLGKTILAHLGKIPFEENFYQGEYLKNIAEKFKDKIDLNQNPEKIGKKIADYILENYIKLSLKKFGTNFDWFFFETELYKGNLKEKLLKNLKNKKLIEEKDGALFLKLTKFGETKDEVLIKKTGEATYFFSDLLHYYYKFFIKKNKIEILIVASDHLDHVRRLSAALKKIFKIKNYQFQPIVYQFVHLKKGEGLLKISKRKGIIITLDDLIKNINPDILRFFFLQKSPNIIVELDLDLMKKETEENPYWYLQYAYARLNSILGKAEKQNLKVPKNLNYPKLIQEMLQIESCREILRSIYKFNDLILICYQEESFNLLIDYLIDFSSKIHSFYEKEKILPNLKKLAFVKFLRDYLDFLFSLLKIKPLPKI